MPNIALKPTNLVVTPSAFAKAAPPTAGGLTRCYAAGQLRTPLKLLLFIAFLVTSFSIPNAIANPNDRYFEGVLKQSLESNKPILVSGCQRNDKRILVVLSSVSSGLFAEFDNGSLSMLGEITFSTRAKTPLIEVDGGIASINYAYGLYAQVRDIPYRLLIKYDYDDVRAKMPLPECKRAVTK